MLPILIQSARSVEYLSQTLWSLHQQKTDIPFKVHVYQQPSVSVENINPGQAMFPPNACFHVRPNKSIPEVRNIMVREMSENMFDACLIVDDDIVAHKDLIEGLMTGFLYGENNLVPLVAGRKLRSPNVGVNLVRRSWLLDGRQYYGTSPTYLWPWYEEHRPTIHPEFLATQMNVESLLPQGYRNGNANN